MGRNKRKYTIGAILALALVASVGFAQKGESRLKVNLKDADLTTATRMIADRTGIQFYFKTTKSFNRVTLQVEDQTADDVIRFICDAAGAYVTKNETGVYVISAEKPVVATEAATTSKAARLFRKIKLLHAGADEIYNRVVLNRILDPLTKQKEMSHALDLARRNSYSSGASSEAVNNIFDSYSKVNSYKTTKAGPEKSEEPLENSIQLPGESSNQRGGGGGGGQLGGPGGGGGGGQLGGAGGGQLGGGGAGGGGNAQLQGGQGLVPDTIEHISYDPTDNSLIVSGTSEDDINQLQNLIAQFDVAPQQVSVRVEFITTTENLDSSLGFGFTFNRGTVVAGLSNQEFLRASDPVFLTYSTGDAVLRLRTRLSEGYGRVVTSPTLRTLNNTPATVTAFTIDYILTSQSQLTNGIVQTQVNPQPFPIGTSLTIAPRINRDGYITMGIAPQVGGTTGTRSVALSNNSSFDLPITTTQAVSAVVRVKNKSTIVIGGLNTESSNTTINRVPVLSDLPVIGQFFRRTVRGKTASELLIFVTPSIIEEEDEDVPL